MTKVMLTLLEREHLNEQAWPIIQEMTSDKGKINPWPYYAQLHELGEIFELPDGTFWVVGYEAVAEALRSPAFGKGGAKMKSPALSVLTQKQADELKEIESDASTNLVVLDGAEHSRIRRIVQGKFTPRNVRTVEASIPVVIDRLLSSLDTKKPIDIMESFSAIFAPEIMAELIGLPSDRRGEVAELAGIGMAALDPGSSFEVMREGVLAGRRLRDYIREVANERRMHPLEDFVTAIVNDPELTEPEKARLMQTLYVGGYGTTAHMVGNGLYLILKNQEQFELLKRDDSLVKPAIEEMLRMDGAISLTAKVTMQDVELAGVQIQEGRRVILLLAAANRDPDVFPDPDKFDVRRTSKKPHLSFAGGAHYCLGVNLARLELEQVFRQLIQRFPNMVLADENPPRTPRFHQQSFEQVRVILDGGAA